MKNHTITKNKNRKDSSKKRNMNSPPIKSVRLPDSHSFSGAQTKTSVNPLYISPISRKNKETSNTAGSSYNLEKKGNLGGAVKLYNTEKKHLRHLNGDKDLKGTWLAAANGDGYFFALHEAGIFADGANQDEVAEMAVNQLKDLNEWYSENAPSDQAGIVRSTIISSLLSLHIKSNSDFESFIGLDSIVTAD